MANTFLRMSDLDLNDKRVIIREDLNVPLQDGAITNDARIQRALPAIKKALAAGARVLLLSHLGRPTEGEFDQAFSLAPVAKALSDALGQAVPLVRDWFNGAVDIAPGQCVLAENVRFLPGESDNNTELAKQMAQQCDVFVMDAFATAHRAQASTVGIAQYAPVACAGPLLTEELDALAAALENPKRPLVAIVGGSKVSTKFQLLESLLDKVDQLIVGGGIANTFLKATGAPIGQSLFEADWVAKAQHILQKAQQQQTSIPLPTDVVVATEFSRDATAVVKPIDAVQEHDMILDIGPETAKHYAALMQKAGTIVWNGPVGVFEFPAFSEGTKTLAQAIANSPAFSIAGGGDTLAALDQFQVADKISYVSTGGGAFLEYLEGEPLPAVNALMSST